MTIIRHHYILCPLQSGFSWFILFFFMPFVPKPNYLFQVRLQIITQCWYVTPSIVCRQIVTSWGKYDTEGLRFELHQGWEWDFSWIHITALTRGNTLSTNSAIQYKIRNTQNAQTSHNTSISSKPIKLLSATKPVKAHNKGKNGHYTAHRAVVRSVSSY